MEPVAVTVPRWRRQAGAFAVRYLRETARAPVGLFWSFAFPAVWYLITAHLGGPSAVEPAAAPAAKAVLGVAFGVFGALTVTLVGVAGDLAEDIDAKRYRTFRSRPVAPSADLAGRFAAGGLVGLASWTVTVAVAATDGASFGLARPESLAVVVLGVCLFCLIGMVAGLATAVAVPKPHHATTIGTGVLVVGFFVTGYNGTVPAMAPFDPALQNVLPNTLTTRLLIRHAVDVDWTAAGLAPPPIPASLGHLGLLAGYGLVLGAVGLWLTRRVVYGTDIGG